MSDPKAIVPPLEGPVPVIRGCVVRLFKAPADPHLPAELTYCVLDDLLRALGFPGSVLADARAIIGTGCELRQAGGATIIPHLMAVALITNAIENGRASQSDLDGYCEATGSFLLAECAGLSVEDAYDRMDEARANSELVAGQHSISSH